MTLKIGLRFAKDFFFLNLIVESDSMNAINVMNQQYSHSYVDVILEKGDYSPREIIFPNLVRRFLRFYGDPINIKKQFYFFQPN